MELLLSYDSKYQPVTIESINDLKTFAEIYFELKSDEIEFYLNDKELNLSNICLTELSGQEVVIKKIQDTNLIRFQIDHITYPLVNVDLYYECWKFKAIVDTGCQKTMMTLDMIKTMNLEDRIDRTVIKKMNGVGGLQNTIGIIRDLEIKICNKYLILINADIIESTESLKNTMLIGLDFMHTYDFSINIRRNEMIIENIKIQLLNEIEIEELNEPINWMKEIIDKSYYKLIDIIGRENMIDINRNIRNIFSNIKLNPYNNKYKSINMNSNLIKQNPQLITFLKTCNWFEKNNKLIFNGSKTIINSVLEII
jgi:hypothetical protein